MVGTWVQQVGTGGEKRGGKERGEEREGGREEGKGRERAYIFKVLDRPSHSHTCTCMHIHVHICRVSVP